MDAAIN